MSTCGKSLTAVLLVFEFSVYQSWKIYVFGFLEAALIPTIFAIFAVSPVEVEDDEDGKGASLVCVRPFGIVQYTHTILFISSYLYFMTMLFESMQTESQLWEENSSEDIQHIDYCAGHCNMDIPWVRAFFCQLQLMSLKRFLFEVKLIKEGSESG